jgi:4-methyl-5(b-hydroxyethyl)-thiazole monophosphate biosynthesis
MEKKETTALVLLVDGVEEMEAVTPIDLLRRAGILVTTAAVGENLTITGRNKIQMIAEQNLAGLRDQLFDVLVVPGGPGVASMRKSAGVKHIVTNHAQSGRVVAAICAAPTVLLDARLLQNRRHTAHFSVKNELPDLVENEEVILDGNILTSRGAGTAIAFAFAIIRVLCPQGTAESIASSICHSLPENHESTL